MEGSSLEILAAGFRADLADVEAFLEALATRLSGAFPDRARVERSGRLAGRRARRIEVDIGGARYCLDATARPPRATRAHVVRGITVKNDELPLERWIDALSDDIAQNARETEHGRAALERLLHN